MGCSCEVLISAGHCAKPSYVLPDDGYLGVSSPATLSRRTDYILRNKVRPVLSVHACE